MAQPSWLGGAATPTIHDPRLIVWKRALGKRQNTLAGAADAANNPLMNDTLRQTMVKLARAL